MVWDVEDFVESVRKEVLEREAKERAATGSVRQRLGTINEDGDGDQTMPHVSLPDRGINKRRFNALSHPPDHIMMDAGLDRNNLQPRPSRPYFATAENTFKPYSNEAKRFDFLQADLHSVCVAEDVDLYRLTRMTHRLGNREIEKAIENA